MATLGEYLGAGSATTKLLLHLNGNSTDSSGNGNNGTDTAITYSAGKFGQGAGFNGSNSKIALSSTFTDLTSNWTVSMWVKRGATGNNIYPLFSRWKSTTQERQLYIYFSSNAISGRQDKIQVDIPYIKAILTSSTTITDSNYHLITVTKNSTTWSIYIDGSLSSSIVDASSQESAQTTSPYIGHNLPDVTTYFNGSLDEVIIENRAWTASEVKKYYSYAKGRFGII